jgi:hypothetical protein
MKQNTTPYSSGDFFNDDFFSGLNSGKKPEKNDDLSGFVDIHHKKVGMNALKNVLSFACSYFVCKSDYLQDIELNLN